MVPLVLIFVLLAARRPLPDRGTLIRTPRPGPATAHGHGARGRRRRGRRRPPSSPPGPWRAALVTSMIIAIISCRWWWSPGTPARCRWPAHAGRRGGLPAHQLPGDLGRAFPIAPILAALGAADHRWPRLGLPAIRVPRSHGRGGDAGDRRRHRGVLVPQQRPQRRLQGGSTVKQPSLFGINLGIGSGSSFPRPAFAFTVPGGPRARRARRGAAAPSRLGSAHAGGPGQRAWPPRRGINVSRVKLRRLRIGAFIAGLGGSMLTYRQRHGPDESFTVVGGLGLFATTYLAGITSVLRRHHAGILPRRRPALRRARHGGVGRRHWYEVITGVLLVLTVVLNPEGIVGARLPQAAARPGGPESGRAARRPRRARRRRGPRGRLRRRQQRAPAQGAGRRCAGGQRPLRSA